MRGCSLVLSMFATMFMAQGKRTLGSDVLSSRGLVWLRRSVSRYLREGLGFRCEAGEPGHPSGTRPLSKAQQKFKESAATSISRTQASISRRDFRAQADLYIGQLDLQTTICSYTVKVDNNSGRTHDRETYSRDDEDGTTAKLDQALLCCQSRTTSASQKVRYVRAGSAETPIASTSYHTQTRSMMCYMLANIFPLPVTNTTSARYLRSAEEPRQWRSREGETACGVLACSSISRCNHGTTRRSTR